jgi:hypothetical protein
VAYVVTLVAFVLVIWIGRRYAELEEMPQGPERDQLGRRLYRLDELWPLAVMVFSSISILVCWLTLPTAA